MHTQGPWAIDTENAGGGFNVVAANGARVLHTSEVATYAPGGPISADEAKANARIAAVAPEMFSTLQKLFAAWLSDADPKESRPLLDEVAAVMQKATR